MGRKPKKTELRAQAVSITLAPGQRDKIDAVVERGEVSSRSEFIRRAVEVALKRAEKRREG
nr:ribbon-helix-helix domain-containing protein [Rhodoplanes elegans]